MGKSRCFGVLIGLALSATVLAAPPGASADRGSPAGAGQEDVFESVESLEDELPDGVAHGDDFVVPPGPDGQSRARYAKWPGKTIRFWVDAPASFDWAIAKGVQAWNDTGLDIRFVETSKARAQLTIRTVKNLRGALGLATLGYYRDPRWRWVKLDVDQLSPNDTWHGFTLEEREVFTAAVVAHELGHTLGLDHAGSRCVLLNPIIWGGTCPFFADEMGHYSCRIVDGMSLGRARRIYGGKQTLAGESCPLDPLPPRLSGVTVSGGGPEADPGVITWAPPRGDLPKGTRIQVLVRRDDTCDFSPRTPLKRLASYPERVKVHLLSPSTDSYEVTATDNAEKVCLAASLVNDSGSGSKPDSGRVTLYTPEPLPPNVTSMRRTFSDPERYQLWIDVPHGPDGKPLEDDVFYSVGPEGECPTSPGSLDEDWYPVGIGEDDGPADAALYAYEERPCFAFATWYRGRYSAVEIHQVGAEPAPTMPVLSDVSVVDDYTIKFRATYDDAYTGLEVLVADQGECVQAWPDDSWGAYTWDEGDGFLRVENYGYAHPCISVFAVNADGVRSAPAIKQL